MPEETKSALVDFSALAKILPIERIYTDLASRGVQQIGLLFEDFVKSIRLALPGVQLSAADQDRFRKAIEDPYFRVKPEQRILPAAQLVGQVLEGVRYEPEGTPLWQMFEELLQRGCDEHRVNEAHPAFAKIISQLSYDEAILLKKISSSSCELVIGYQKGIDDFEELDIDSVGKELSGDLVFSKNAMIYANHLEALGLVHDLVGIPKDKEENSDKNIVVWELHISTFGKAFYKAILRDIRFEPVV